MKNGRLRFKGITNFVRNRWVKIDLVGNRGNATYVEKAAYLRKSTDADWITWKCPRFQWIFRARVKKKCGKDTYKKGLPHYLCFNDTISLLFSWQICIILSTKDTFLTTWLVLAAAFLCCKVILWKIIDNHSSINMDFIWLVTWSGFKRFWRKRIYRLKNCLPVIIIFYNKDHQPSIARSSPCSCWDHLFPFYLLFILIWTDDTFSFWISFLNFWLGSFWCAFFFLIDLLS